MTRVVFLGPAEEEMLAASAYYERQGSRLGREFLAEVQRIVRGIVDNPGAGSVVGQPIGGGSCLGFHLASSIALTDTKS